MQQSNRYILFFILSLGAIGSIYFLSLLCIVPYFVTVAVVIAALVFLSKYFVEGNHPSLYAPAKTSWLQLIICTIGLSILVNRALNVAVKYGGWDAWAIWNFHAKYLTDPAHWKILFRNVENDHPDYPLALPSAIAFFSRLSPGPFSVLVPFAVSIAATISAPAIIFGEFAKKNLLVASLAFFLLAGNEYYILCGVSQYADTLLGLFFLCALVCLEHAVEQKKYLAIAAAFLGCCMWTKNEGTILAGMTFVFYAPRLLAIRNIKYTIAGIAVPLTTLVLFKLICHAPNDMISSLGPETVKLLTEKDRYLLIWKMFNQNMNEHVPYIEGLLLLYLCLCLFGKKWPGRQMALTLTCLIIYMLIYVISRYGLEWHLGTSQGRLMVQLLPAVVYAMALKFAGKGTEQKIVFTRQF